MGAAGLDFLAACFAALSAGAVAAEAVCDFVLVPAFRVVSGAAVAVEALVAGLAAFFVTLSAPAAVGLAAWCVAGLLALSATATAD